MRLKDIGLQYMREETFRFVAQAPDMANSPDRSWFTFIFDRRFADHRHSPCMFANQYRSTLSVLLEVLDDQERKRIFSGVFDIGNGLKVPRTSRSYAALERDLARGRKGDVLLLKPIKGRLGALVGVSVQQYFKIDPSITLKVLMLLFRYQNGIDSGLSSPRLFSFLELPNKRRPSFEFHPSFEISGAPKIEGTTDKQRIIDELTVHLGSELGSQLREKVRSTFMSLADNLASIEIRLKQKLSIEARGSIELYQQACARAQNHIGQLRDIYSTGRVIQRLDLDLLIFLSRVQVENRNSAHSEVTDFIKELALPIQEIEADVIRLNSFFDPKSHGRAVNIEIIEVSEIEGFLVQWADHLCSAMEKAFGIAVTNLQYERASRTACKISRVDPVFSWGLRGITMLDVLGLLCTAHAAAEHRNLFFYKPYWHGQRNQSDRPFHQLDDRASSELNAIPEGRVAYWRQCQTWIKSALIGQLPFYEMNLGLTKCINEALSRVIASHDLDAMQGFVTKLGRFAANE